jgi:hypothetical protein
MHFPFWKRGDLPVLTVPYLRDCDDGRKAELVRQICRKAAEQLSTHLFKWEKQYPSKSCVKSYDPVQRKFLGMNIALFQDFIMNHYSVRTPDGNQWLLDRKLADLIWAECIAADSPLPPASFDIEAERRRAGK